MLIAFNDMIGDMEVNKKSNPIVICFSEEECLTFHLFLHKILFQSTSDHKTKFDSVFYQGNTQQKRTSTNSIESFAWYWF